MPTWNRPIASVLIALQPWQSFVMTAHKIEQEKQGLRQQFLIWAGAIAQSLQQTGELAEIFDPRTGLPMLSASGSLCLDDVAVVRTCLGYPVIAIQGCVVIQHPQWGVAVYPSTLVASASPARLQRVVEQCYPFPVNPRPKLKGAAKNTLGAKEEHKYHHD